VRCFNEGRQGCVVDCRAYCRLYEVRVTPAVVLVSTAVRQERLHEDHPRAAKESHALHYECTVLLQVWTWESLL